MPLRTTTLVLLYQNVFIHSGLRMSQFLTNTVKLRNGKGKLIITELV